VNINVYIQHSQEATIRSSWEWLSEADGEVEHMVISTALQVVTAYKCGCIIAL